MYVMSITFLSNKQFSTSADLINQLVAGLINAGWTELGRIQSGAQLKGRSYSDDCFLQIKTVNRPGGQSAIELQGSLDATFTSMSPSLSQNLINNSQHKSLLDLRYQPGITNKFWLTASADAFVLAIQNANNTNISAWWFGFLDRLDYDKDPFGWGLGPVHWGYGDTYMAKSFIGGQDWWYLGSAYSADMNSDSFNISNSYGLNVTNAKTQSIKPFINPYSQSAMWNRAGTNTTNSATQVCGNVFVGNSLNGSGTIKPFPFWLQEIESMPRLDQDSLPYVTVFRGFVKFVVTGFGHLANGSVISAGNQYLAISRGCTSAIIIG